jgi:hypothetical protein
MLDSCYPEGIGVAAEFKANFRLFIHRQQRREILAKVPLYKAVNLARGGDGLNEFPASPFSDR